MSSSTSSSEAGGAEGPAEWARFALTFVAAATLLSAAFLGTAFLIDPYDTGRSPLALKAGVPPQGPRTALASRGHDPRFTGAIIGNPHIQLVSPERLREKTGIPFVSLIAPATRPKESLATIDWFLRHHRSSPAQAIVVGVDRSWCTSDPSLLPDHPFPFWLLSRDTAAYLGGLMRYDLIEALPRRVAYLLSENAGRGRPDGYWDYDAAGSPPRAKTRTSLETPIETGGGNVAGPFPAAAGLEALMAAAPQTALILVRPPVYVTALPRPGTRDASADAACREAFAGLATRRAKTALVDWRVDRPPLHDPNLFFDHGHYRQPIARLLEQDIADALGKVAK